MIREYKHHFPEGKSISRSWTKTKHQYIQVVHFIWLVTAAGLEVGQAHWFRLWGLPDWFLSFDYYSIPFDDVYQNRRSLWNLISPSEHHLAGISSYAYCLTYSKLNSRSRWSAQGLQQASMAIMFTPGVILPVQISLVRWFHSTWLAFDVSDDHYQMATLFLGSVSSALIDGFKLMEMSSVFYLFY